MIARLVLLLLLVALLKAEDTCKLSFNAPCAGDATKFEQSTYIDAQQQLSDNEEL